MMARKPCCRRWISPIHPGTALTLIGESGSGKSLLAHALMGTLPAPTGRGEMVSGGRHHNLAGPPRLRTLWGRELAMLPQEPVLALDPTMGLLAPGGGRAAARRQGGPIGPCRPRGSLDWPGGRAPLYTSSPGRHGSARGLCRRHPGEARLLVADRPTKGETRQPGRSQAGCLVAGLPGPWTPSADHHS